MNRVIQELRATMEIPNPNNLDLWIRCSCENLRLEGANVQVENPHLDIDLRQEGRCLELAARGQDYLNQIRDPAIADRHKPVPNTLCVSLL